ncbi:hypothetical protein FNH09_02095 [Streptomyces adustus]|uniref:Uncharacterized protein n=1 Tax=Streptomyces adustus TaxID=1609272 RepID=A0A5N8V4Y3_9ACTN|nr:hypothetical protein [Streptomyces adustus]MPY30149.1 hypothetical protein [Streptomyces adustus]
MSALPKARLSARGDRLVRSLSTPRQGKNPPRIRRECGQLRRHAGLRLCSACRAVVEQDETLWSAIVRFYRTASPWKNGCPFNDPSLRAAYRRALDDCIAERQEFTTAAQADLG